MELVPSGRRNRPRGRKDGDSERSLGMLRRSSMPGRRAGGLAPVLVAAGMAWRLFAVSVSTNAEHATASARVVGVEAGDFEISELLGDTLDQSEMQLADDARVGDGHGLVRAALEDKAEIAARVAAGRLEALVVHLAFQGVERIGASGGSATVAPSGLSSRLVCGLTVAHGLGQEKSETLVGAGGSPRSAGAWVTPVAKPRSAGLAPRLDFLDDKSGFADLGQVLAHGVVVRRNASVSSATSTDREALNTYRKIWWRKGSPRARACCWIAAVATAGVALRVTRPAHRPPLLSEPGPLAAKDSGLRHPAGGTHQWVRITAS